MIRRIPTVAALLVLLVPPASGAPAAAGRADAVARHIRIVYDDLVDRSAWTHSGKTVGEILSEASRPGGLLPAGVQSDLQPYLEPFSFVCDEMIAPQVPRAGKPYANVVDEYPQGSRQPAWAALFREGHYQLFAGEGRARLFLKGENPAALFRRHHGVVRHPLLKILEKSGRKEITLEVYAFRNDYRSRTLTIDTVPYVVRIGPAELAPRARGIPLEGLSDFFAQGNLPEAAEIDDGGDFYLYGRKAGGQTVVGRPVTLADFAVVYRAVFHHGRNHPYISLDRAEDNRFAKVNFGGFLSDTPVGTVLLEADKLFKTMMTGVDPDTRVPVADRIRAAVPDFRTVDERALFRKEQESGQVRFWFYPDRIRTVTDGRVGVVESSRFMADQERVEGKILPHRAGREAIDHLNRNFERYAEALPPFRELETLGRLMAIVKWLQGVDARRRIDLDALLSVEIPPHKTPRRTRKILAVTDGVRVVTGGRSEERHETISLDNLVEQGAPSTNDGQFIAMAEEHVRRGGSPSLMPQGLSRYYADVTRYTVTTVIGGVNLNPAKIAAPRRAPDSPLLARFRKSLSTRGGEELTRSTLRGSTPAPRGASMPQRPARPPGPAPKAAPPEPAPPAEAAPRRPAKGSVLKTTSYPAEILVTGDPSGSATFVLKKGRAISAPPGTPP